MAPPVYRDVCGLRCSLIEVWKAAGLLARADVGPVSS